MKAFCYVGSNSKNSLGNELSLKLERQLNDQGITTYFYRGRNTNINWCAGCSQCFKTGECSLAKSDDMGNVRKNMRESDIIIWISPVYALNVSGMMKNYLDRIASWTHTFELAGKLGVVADVSSNSGLEFTNYYLKRVLQAMGCNVIGAYQVDLSGNKTIEEISMDITKDINRALDDNKLYSSTKEMEDTYQKLKRVFTSIEYNAENTNAYETCFWQSISKEGYEGLSDFINFKRESNSFD